MSSIHKLSSSITSLTVSDGDVVDMDDISSFSGEYTCAISIQSGPQGVALRPSNGQQINGNSGDLKVFGQVSLTISSGNWIATSTSGTTATGTGTLTAGQATVSDARVTSSSLIFPTNTGSNLGVLTVTSQGTGTFTVKSTDSADASTFGYLVM